MDLDRRDVSEEGVVQFMMHRWLGHDILDQSSGQKYLTSSEYLGPPPGPPPTYNHIAGNSSKSNSYHGEPYIPADVFNVSR